MKKHPLILVVDDDQEILDLVSTALELDGYDVATAIDGNSALALAEERRPDLVLLDIVMPKLDGFQVLRFMRQRFDFPIIMLTGKCEASVVRDAIDLGADDYVRKPFTVGELAARIKAKLRRSGFKRWDNLEAEKMIRTVIRCQSDMVIVFDDEGKQIPTYQGHYPEVREHILTDALPNAVFAHGFNSSGELRRIAREEW